MQPIASLRLIFSFDQDDMMTSRGTTTPGYENKNGQIVLSRTSRKGTDHNQYIYILRCKHCGLKYGTNGSDIWQRKCPTPPSKCKEGGGKKGIITGNQVERCSICGCRVHHDGGYAQPNPRGRAHATRHHYVAERFFGRNANQPLQQREPIFPSCPWDAEGKTAIFCYDCHEELLHNPVLLPEDITALARLVAARHINEDVKTNDRTPLGERIKLLHEVIALGLQEISTHKK